MSRPGVRPAGLAGAGSPARRAMITAAEVEKLRGVRGPAASVLSVYLPVQPDPAALRRLPALAGELIDAAVTAGGQGEPGSADRDDVQHLARARGREWLGRTAAIFACGQLGLLEAVPLPGQLPGRAVLAARPHIRPLLASLQRCPAYLVAIVDRRHGWLLSVSGDLVETITRREEPAVPGRGPGGWYGREAQRAQRRIQQLSGDHYRSLAAILEDRGLAGDVRPVVLGGDEDSVRKLTEVLPLLAAEAVAGSFSADARTLTRARARELADPIVARWAERREQEAATRVLEAEPAGLAARGLPGCLAAVSADAADLLLIPDEGLVPGFACRRCGALTVTGDECPDWGTAAQPVPDLLEEMATRVLDDGGQVVAVRPPLTAAARLRYPVAGLPPGRLAARDLAG